MSTLNVLKNSLVLSRTDFVELLPVDDSTEQLWKSFGTWYQKEREQKGKTQEDVAKSAGIHAKTVSRLETGESGTKRATVVKLAKAINIDPKIALDKAGFKVPENDEHGGFARQLDKLPPGKRKLALRQINSILESLADTEEEFDFDYGDFGEEK